MPRKVCNLAHSLTRRSHASRERFNSECVCDRYHNAYHNVQSSLDTRLSPLSTHRADNLFQIELDPSNAQKYSNRWGRSQRDLILSSSQNVLLCMLCIRLYRDHTKSTLPLELLVSTLDADLGGDQADRRLQLYAFTGCSWCRW